jgi:hypothetical protein
MRSTMIFAVLAASALVAQADDLPNGTPFPAKVTAAGADQPGSASSQPPPGIVPVPAWSPRPPRPRPIAPATTVDRSPAAQDRAEGSSAKFSTVAKWDLAGYNNNEIIYTITITSHDRRILRCTTLLQGVYYESGKKHTVSDRQTTTVFPEQPTTAGNWQGMDRKSGATYSVKCHSA